MRSAHSILVVLTLCGGALAETHSELSLNGASWRTLPVLDGGRIKPFDTLALETCRTISNRTELNDPDTDQQLNAHTLYLAMLLEWQGWDRQPQMSTGHPGHSVTSYFRLHQPDKWDRSPLLRVDFIALRHQLGLEPHEKHISPVRLSTAKIRLSGIGEERPFLRWAESLAARQAEGLTVFETRSLELADKYWSYQDHRVGNRLRLVPLPKGGDDQWLSLAELWRTNYDDATDPDGHLRQSQQAFARLRAAYQAQDSPGFQQASAAFLAAVQQTAPETDVFYPQPTKMIWEVAYNQWAPFRFAWVLMLIAMINLVLSLGTDWKALYVGGWVACGAALVAMLVGFGMRMAISERAPVTNMYESVIYVGLGVAILGVVLELRCRKRYVLTAAASVATVMLILADNCPAALDASFRPLQPVLQSNFWLVTHVLTITLSYAAFALALGIGNITLGCYLRGSTDCTAIGRLTNYTYWALQVGVVLLVSGTFLGGIWADYAWGRFWDWDPKEVWALIALLGFLAVLQAHFAGWVGQFGLAAFTVICFSLVVMAWYGVNFVLGAGLHSYGFGGGGRRYVFGGVALQFLYVGVAAARYALHRSVERRDRSTGTAPARALSA